MVLDRQLKGTKDDRVEVASSAPGALLLSVPRFVSTDLLRFAEAGSRLSLTIGILNEADLLHSHPSCCRGFRKTSEETAPGTGRTHRI